MADSQIQTIYVSPSEVAQRLGVSEGHVYRLVKQKAIPAIICPPNRMRVPRQAFDEWVARQTNMALQSVEHRELSAVGAK